MIDTLPNLDTHPAFIARHYCACCGLGTGWVLTVAEAHRAGWRLLRTATNTYALCPQCAIHKEKASG